MFIVWRETDLGDRTIVSLRRDQEAAHNLAYDLQTRRGGRYHVQKVAQEPEPTPSSDNPCETLQTKVQAYAHEMNLSISALLSFLRDMAPSCIRPERLEQTYEKIDGLVKKTTDQIRCPACGHQGPARVTKALDETWRLECSQCRHSHE